MFKKDIRNFLGKDPTQKIIVISLWGKDTAIFSWENGTSGPKKDKGSGLDNDHFNIIVSLDAELNQKH